MYLVELLERHGKLTYFARRKDAIYVEYKLTNVPGLCKALQIPAKTPASYEIWVGDDLPEQVFKIPGRFTLEIRSYRRQINGVLRLIGNNASALIKTEETNVKVEEDSEFRPRHRRKQGYSSLRK